MTNNQKVGVLAPESVGRVHDNAGAPLAAPEITNHLQGNVGAPLAAPEIANHLHGAASRAPTLVPTNPPFKSLSTMVCGAMG